MRLARPLKDPKLVARFAGIGGSEPLRLPIFRQLIADETEKWRKVV